MPGGFVNDGVVKKRNDKYAGLIYEDVIAQEIRLFLQEVAQPILFYFLPVLACCCCFLTVYKNSQNKCTIFMQKKWQKIKNQIRKYMKKCN